MSHLPIAYPTNTLVRIRHGPHPIDLHVKTYGNPADPPLLLVNGIGANKESTPEKTLYEALAQQQFFVVSFSNRDSGGSTKMEHLRTRSMLATLGFAALAGLALPASTLALLLLCVRHFHVPAAKNITALVLASFLGFKVAGGTNLPKLYRFTPAYTLNDVAEDIVLLMDAMQLTKVHIIGASMGGMLGKRTFGFEKRKNKERDKESKKQERRERLLWDTHVFCLCFLLFFFFVPFTFSPFPLFPFSSLS